MERLPGARAARRLRHLPPGGRLALRDHWDENPADSWIPCLGHTRY